MRTDTPHIGPMSDPSILRPHERIQTRLQDAGFDEETALALLALDGDHFHYVRIQCGYGRAPQEATVGLLAEEMAIDPSRASRIAADLVERGLLTRAVSQQDGRRSVLVPTEAAWGLMDGFLQAKWQRTMQLFATWSKEDIVTFARLFGCYTDGMREQYPIRT
jgi:DNA-binding MarR family transcriptional regulator